MSVDLSAAQEFLRNRLGSWASDVALAGAGEWSRAFSFEAEGEGEGEEFIVRFGAHVEDFEKDRRAFAFRAPALPIPEVAEIGEAFGGFYAISRRVSGVMLDHLGHDELVRTLPALFRGLDAVRAADISATSGFGLWGADGTVSSGESVTIASAGSRTRTTNNTPSPRTSSVTPSGLSAT